MCVPWASPTPRHSLLPSIPPRSSAPARPAHLHHTCPTHHPAPIPLPPSHPVVEFECVNRLLLRHVVDVGVQDRGQVEEVREALGKGLGVERPAHHTSHIINIRLHTYGPDALALGANAICRGGTACAELPAQCSHYMYRTWEGGKHGGWGVRLLRSGWPGACDGTERSAAISIMQSDNNICTTSTCSHTFAAQPVSCQSGMQPVPPGGRVCPPIPVGGMQTDRVP